MHIWIINQSFRPETNAPSNRFYGLGGQWLKHGQRVTALVGQPYRPHGKLPEGFDGTPMVHDVDGITVKRHAEKMNQKKKAIPQAISQLSFAWNVLKANWTVAEEDKPDVIIASSPDFFHTLSGWLLSRRHKASFIMEVRDLWPDIFKDLGLISNRFILWALSLLAKFVYGRASAVVTVTKGYAAQLVTKGVKAEKVYVIPNAVNDADFQAADRARAEQAGNRIRSELQINPLSKVILYVGNHGKAQGLGQLVDAARLLMNRSDIQFVLVGDGADKQRLQDLAKGLPNLQFLPNQSKDKVWALYDMCTLSVSCLRDIPSFNTTIPSKIFEIMAAQVPLIACLQGEAADIVTQAEAGVVVPPEQPDKLAAAITSLIDAPARMDLLAKNGREFADAERRYSMLAKQYLGLLNKIAPTQK